MCVCMLHVDLKQSFLMEKQKLTFFAEPVSHTGGCEDSLPSLYSALYLISCPYLGTKPCEPLHSIPVKQLDQRKEGGTMGEKKEAHKKRGCRCERKCDLRRSWHPG